MWQRHPRAGLNTQHDKLARAGQNPHHWIIREHSVTCYVTIMKYYVVYKGMLDPIITSYILTTCQLLIPKEYLNTLWILLTIPGKYDTAAFRFQEFVAILLCY